MGFAFQPVSVRTDSADEDGRLVFADGRLVALLVRLSGGHDELAGRWFLETCFAMPIGGPHPVFSSLSEAETWLQ